MLRVSGLGAGLGLASALSRADPTRSRRGESQPRLSSKAWSFRLPEDGSVSGYFQAPEMAFLLLIPDALPSPPPGPVSLGRFGHPGLQNDSGKDTPFLLFRIWTVSR